MQTVVLFLTTLLSCVCVTLSQTTLTLDAQLVKDVNDHINSEYDAFYLYEDLAAYFAQSDKALFGFSAYFRKAADEEIHHAREFTEFLLKRSGIVALKSIIIPLHKVGSWNSSSEAVQAALVREVEIAEKMNTMYAKAEKTKDRYLQEFLDHFLKEQVEAVYRLKSLSTRLKGKGEIIEFLLDKELADKPSMHE